MRLFTKFRFFLWYFGLFKVAMIGYVRPKLVVLDDKKIVVRLRLRRRTRNHLHSMYFGALAVGADIAGGLHAFYHAHKEHIDAAIVFKSFEAEFLKRPESDVYFISDMGDVVRAMLLESKNTGERVNKPINISGVTDYPSNPQHVAQFVLELSVKVLK